MTQAFERFLRSFSDEELQRFARERGEARPPYWRAMRLALAIEAHRRGLALDGVRLGPLRTSDEGSTSRDTSTRTEALAGGR